MDPKACLELLEQALNAQELDEARCFLEAYQGWRARGGFEPTDGDRLANRCAYRLAALENNS